jgi:anti-sigma factor RsiW
VSDVTCKKFDRSISLYLDGELDERGERALREHLSTCRRCAERLAALESAQKSAKTAKAAEPHAGYWDTFSSRVSEKIDARAGQPAGSRLKRLVELIAPTPGHRLRFAAGLASIALAFTAGVLYINRQGGPVLPSSVPVPVEEPLGPVVAKDDSAVQRKAMQMEEAPKPKETPAAPVTGGAGAQNEPEADALKVAAKEEVPRPTRVRETAKAATDVTEHDKAADVPQAPEQLAEGKDAEKAADNQPMTREALQSITVSEKTSGAARAQTPATVRQGAKSAPVVQSYAVGGTTLHKITERDTLIGEDELRKLIAAWTARIEEDPPDSLASEGYQQVASAYCLLARQTRDEGVVSEGARVIETYLDRAKSPAVREFLAAKLAEIQSLQKK